MSDIDKDNNNYNSEQTTSELTSFNAASDEFTTNNVAASSTGTENNGKKGKKMKKLIGASIIGVAACAAIAVFAGPKIADVFSKSSKAAPIDRFKNVFTRSMDKAKKESLDSITAHANSDITLDMNLSLGDFIMSSVPEQYQFINGIGAKFNIINYEDNHSLTGNLSTKSGTLISVEEYGNNKNPEFTLRIPELSDSFLKISAEDFVEGFMPGMPSVNSVNSVSPEELINLMVDECGIFTGAIKDVTLKEDSKLEVNGISAEYDQLTTVIPAKEVGDLVYECSKHLFDSTIFGKLVAIADTGDSKDDLLKEVKEWSEHNSVGITMDLYLDNDDNVKGFKITPTKDDDSSLEFAYLSAIDKKTGFTLYVMEDNQKLFSLDGTHEESKGSYTGSMTFNINQNQIIVPVCTINYKDLKSEKDTLQGTVSLEAPALNGIGFLADFDMKNNSGTIALKATMASNDLIALNIAVDQKKADSCPTIPDNANIVEIKTDSDIQAYLQSVDVIGFTQHIKELTGIDLSNY